MALNRKNNGVNGPLTGEKAAATAFSQKKIGANVI